MSLAALGDLLQNIISVLNQRPRVFLQFFLLLSSTFNGDGCLIDDFHPLLFVQFGIEKLQCHFSNRCAQNRFEFAQRPLDKAEAFVEPLINDGVNGMFEDEVEHRDFSSLLTKAIDSSDTLFETHRVPGQIVVDHDPAEL